MSPRSARAVPAINGVVAAALVAALAAVALVVRPPAPPGIAEFAPQASKPISKAPLGQTTGVGAGTGACQSGSVCAAGSPRPTAVPSTVASLKPGAFVPGGLQCYMWPDGTVTQTFDPQSPPCIAAWEETSKGNGGATARGVTKTEIQIAMPVDGFFSQQWPEIYAPVVNFINSHFMLYGRQFVVKPFTSRMVSGNRSGEAQAADARAAIALKPFAALPPDIVGQGGDQPTYFDRVADAKILGVGGVWQTGTLPESVFRRHDPYLWSYLPTWESLQANLATLTCRQLAGKVASHSTAFRSEPRKYALLVPAPASNNGAPTPDTSVLVGGLASCGVTITRTVEYDNTTSQGSNALAASFVQLNQDKVTSLLYVRDGGAANNPSVADYAAGTQYGPLPTASRVGYHPEWIYVGNEPASFAENPNKDQTSALFGIAPWNKTLPAAQSSWYQAHIQGGGKPAEPNSRADSLYHALMLLASGVQAAGPHLTPESFAEALRELRFPNPATGEAPTWEGRVGVAPGAYSMVYDFAAAWVPKDSQSKLWCYVEDGARWSGDSWGRQDQFFSDPNC